MQTEPRPVKYFAALGIALLVIAASSVGPWAPSPFTSQTGTNTTAAAWRVALGVTSSASLTNAALVGGTVVNQTNTSLTAARVLVTDANKVPTNSAVTTTTLGYLDATSSIQTQLDAKPTVALTNLALLNGTNTFTASKFFPANNIGLRLLWSSPTNIYLASLAVSAATAFTNNGDFANCTPVIQATLPALLGSNSSIVLSGNFLRTNANTTSGNIVVFAGTNTNFVGLAAGALATTVGISGYNLASQVFQNANSMTNQVQGTSLNSTLIPSVTNFVDTSVPFAIYVGLSTVTSHTNAQYLGLRIYEIYAP